jgi:glycosyltransferase involved in cell wall biosynthesis
MGSRIKVVYVIGSLDVGGTEGQLVQLVTRLDPRRFEPLVCCLSSSGPYSNTLKAAGIHVEVIGLRRPVICRPHKVTAEIARLVRFMQTEKPFIVHALLFWAYIIGAYAARLVKVPVIITGRRGLGHFKADKPCYLSLERFANRMTDVIVANSEAVKHDTIQREGVDSSRIRVVYNGIDVSQYDCAPDPELRASLQIPSKAPVVGVVANLIHYKGHRFLLEAAQQVLRGCPSVKFLLIGDGPYRMNLEALAKDLGLEKSVTFLGRRQDVPRLLALMDLLVLPSLEEGFPNAILEAMAAGKPVVATRVGGVQEAVLHNTTGLLVAPRDVLALSEAIHSLLGDSIRARAMGRAGRDRVATSFGIDRMVSETQQLYEELAKVKGATMVAR